MKRNKALISGIFGQDGYYISAFLKEKGYEVFGFDRHPKSHSETISGAQIIEGSLSDSKFIVSIIKKLHPDEIYNLGGLSSPGNSWESPIEYFDSNTTGVINLLEAIRLFSPKSRLFQASSSEMFGDTDVSPQDELTPFHPRNPYAVSKVSAHWLIKLYREKYNLFACSGIMYNHESPRRSTLFVTRKITSMVARIKRGEEVVLELGNLESRRDWGFAKDYVEAMWKMLQQKMPDDFIIATGKTHSVEEFVEEAFRVVDLKIIWVKDKNSGRESGFDKDGKLLVRTTNKFVRTNDAGLLCGNASKAQKILGWSSSISFENLVKKMVEFDLNEDSKL